MRCFRIQLFLPFISHLSGDSWWRNSPSYRLRGCMPVLHPWVPVLVVTSNRLPFYRLARKTESYSKAFVFIIAVTEVGCSDGVRARSDPVIGFEKRRVRPTDRLNITYLAHKRSVLFGFTAPRA